MELNTKIIILFNTLRSERSSLPPAGTMRETLKKFVPQRGSTQKVANTKIIRLFATASVEMWHRSVHSFLISSSLTNVSTLWASIAGYYSSHYTVRAIAHLLGLYQLRHKRCTVKLKPSGLGFICDFSKSRKMKEHQFYWNEVKKDKNFINEELFTENPEDNDISDAGHRNFATYIDHLNNFPNFSPLNYDELKQRIEYISKIELSSYPIPDKTKYPDIDTVQIVAYHRLVYYRELIDEIVNLENNFWSVHRNPSWCRDIINFQRVKPRIIESIGVSSV